MSILKLLPVGVSVSLERRRPCHVILARSIFDQRDPLRPS